MPFIHSLTGPGIAEPFSQLNFTGPLLLSANIYAPGLGLIFNYAGTPYPSVVANAGALLLSANDSHIDLNPNQVSLNNSVRIGVNGSVTTYTAAGSIRTVIDDGSGNLKTLGDISPGNHLLPSWTAPALPANPLVSGTVYQNTSGGPMVVIIPVTGTIAGTVQLALGVVTPPPNWGGAETLSLNETKNLTLIVPQGYYYSITAASETIGTCQTLGI